jgi:hypothetical protein
MATQTLHYDPNGGPLQARLRCGNAQQGTYRLHLLDTDQLTELNVWTGDFDKPSVDTLAIPGPLPALNGRFLYCVAQVALMPPFNSATVFVTVLQGDKELGTAADTETNKDGTETDLAIEVDVTVALSSLPAGAR